MATPPPLARNIVGACLLISAFISMWLPPTLHHYLIDRKLAISEVVELDLPLFKKWESDNPARVPYAYKFEVNGVEYRGDQFMSEEALLVNYETGEVRSRVVYALDNPVYNRMEPVLTMGGIRWVAIFPKLLFLAATLSLVAWLVSSWEHLGSILARRRMGRRSYGDEWGLVILNGVAAATFLLAPAFLFGSFLTFNDNYPLFTDYPHLVLPVAVVLLAMFPINGLIGRRLDERGRAAREAGGLSSGREVQGTATPPAGE